MLFCSLSPKEDKATASGEIFISILLFQFLFLDLVKREQWSKSQYHMRYQGDVIHHIR